MHEVVRGIAPCERRAWCDEPRDAVDGSLLRCGSPAGDHRLRATHGLDVRQAETLVPRRRGVDRGPANQIPDESPPIPSHDVHDPRGQAELRSEFDLPRNMEPRARSIEDLGDVDHVRMISLGEPAEDLLESLRRHVLADGQQPHLRRIREQPGGCEDGAHGAVSVGRVRPPTLERFDPEPVRVPRPPQRHDPFPPVVEAYGCGR